MIYFLTFVLLFLPVLKYDLLAKTGGENKWYYFNLIVLILLAGLRYRVGGDTLMYMAMFDSCPDLSDLKYFNFEVAQYNPLWYIFNAVCKTICDEFFFFQLIHATIVNISFFSFFRKYCPKYYFSAVLLYYIGYYCYFNMEILREILAICLLLYAARFLLNKNYICYYAVSLFAVFIHYSALVMFLFPLMFIFVKKVSWKQQILIFIIIFILSFLVNIPILLLSMLSLDEQLMLIVERYIENERNIFGMLALILQYLPILGLIYLREKFQITTTMRFIPIVGCVVFVYAFSLNLAGLNRFVNYFVPFILIYIIDTVYYILAYIKPKFTYSYIAFIFTLFLLNFNYIYYYVKDMSSVLPNTRFYSIFYPYHSVLFPQRDEHREQFIENYREVIINF
ncbi:MAG: EpsG family protein [Bacteroidaceae bacterium]|nr:EpsG family protein [Bacteroidaceae bacterium]